MHYPDISIIVPVYNEAKIINRFLEQLCKLTYPGNYEIIVVDGHTNNTTLKAITFGKSIVPISSNQGRAVQMNTGAQIARGTILLFVHADTSLPAEGLTVIARTLYTRRIVGGAFQLGIASQNIWLKIVEHVANIRSRLSRIPYGDQSIFIQKNYFDQIGGYPDIPLMEDVELMRRIKRRGGQITLLKLKNSTSPRRWHAQGMLYCTLRNWVIYSMYILGVSAQKLVKYY